MENHFSKIKFFTLALWIGLMQQAVAQDGIVFRDLEVNPSLINAKKPIQKKSEKSLLKLPFFDDFANLNSPFPNNSLWENNNQVFINASFPLFPPTVGVATFDALDANGRLYEHAAPWAFPADTLTARPIQMDSVFGINPRPLTLNDTVFFSFYYQPGGGFGNRESGTRRGQAPRSEDVLILEFLNGLNGQWVQVWDINGQTLAEFCQLCIIDSIGRTTDSTTARFIEDFEKQFFKQVVIPIYLPSFLYNGFQFRFRNLSSIPSEPTDGQPSIGGQWHIDYVRLDTTYAFPNDIAFVEQSKNVLKDFQAMPYKQFRPSQDLVTEIPLLLRNLSSIGHQAYYQYRILNQDEDEVYIFPPEPTNIPKIDPFSSHGFFRLSPPLSYDFQNNKKPGIFRVQHIMKQPSNPANPDIGTDNDTMTQIVRFNNFYAYDDGTPEFGFGFTRQNERAISEFAYRFPLREKDTLIGVQIWFNHSQQEEELGRRAFFNLAVWGALNDSTPAQNPIVSRDTLPIYNDTIGFVTYWFDKPTVLDAGNFFVGLQQHNNFFLNIGFDQNNNAEKRMFYNLNDNVGWRWLFNYGAAMIRPVFGSSRESTRIYERNIVENNIKVFPNPSDGELKIEHGEWKMGDVIEIYNLNGQRVFSERINSQFTIHNSQLSINISHLPKGIYILVLHTESSVVSKKIVRR
jgi:hypothetical protein